MTRDLYDVNFLAKLINPVIAVIAGAMLLLISAEQVPALHRVAPRYLKVVTSWNFCAFILISALTHMLINSMNNIIINNSNTTTTALQDR